MHDPFRPQSEPARRIYDAFQAEAARRPGRESSEWLVAERQAVWRAACDAASEMGLRAPTMALVEATERSASGSFDYGATWAFAIVNSMRRVG